MTPADIAAVWRDQAEANGLDVVECVVHLLGAKVKSPRLVEIGRSAVSVADCGYGRRVEVEEAARQPNPYLRHAAAIGLAVLQFGIPKRRTLERETGR